VNALSAADGPIVSPPDPLAVSAHELAQPGLSGPRTLFLPRLDRARFPKLGVCGSPLYLLPKITQLASEGYPLGVVATSLERGAEDLLAQRGFFSRFEVRRVPGEPTESDEAPSPEALPESALGQLLLGSALLQEGKLPDAATALEKAIALAPDLPGAHYELGKLRLRTDDMDGAIASFRRSAELLPDFASGWGNLGAALGETGRLEEATEVLHRAVALDPASAPLTSNLGAAYRDQGRLDDAEAQFRKVQRLAPEFVFGYYNLAGVHFLQGRYEEALDAFSKARARDRSRSPRQSLLLAATRLAAGDTEGALREYREVFGRQDVPAKAELRRMAEWDLKELARHAGLNPALRKAADLIRELAT